MSKKAAKELKKLYEVGTVIAIDMDKTLCEGTAWSPEEVMSIKPNQKMIEVARIIGAKKYLVIWTARRDIMIPETLKWLRHYGVPFQAISNNKMAADLYIDDKAFHYSQVEEMLLPEVVKGDKHAKRKPEKK